MLINVTPKIADKLIKNGVRNTFHCGGIDTIEGVAVSRDGLRTIDIRYWDKSLNRFEIGRFDRRQVTVAI